MPARTFWFYIMSNASRTLYVGMTNDIIRRVSEHKTKQCDGFTRRYKITMLVFLEEYPDALSAIDREKQIKRWNREKKIWLIETQNPDWHDLSHDWFG